VSSLFETSIEDLHFHFLRNEEPSSIIVENHFDNRLLPLFLQQGLQVTLVDLSQILSNVPTNHTIAMDGLVGVLGCQTLLSFFKLLHLLI
jgi:hypothetical protein